ncbi:MAG: hypothetical protein ABI175_06890, partial [Polyangiales bacterium]
SVTFWGTQCAQCRVKLEARANAARGAEVTAHGWLENVRPFTVVRIVFALLALLIYFARNCG